MKYVLVLLVVVVAAWLLFGRRRVRPPADKPAPPSVDAKTMLACVHCGVHVPGAEVLRDAAGRPFCSEAHRLAGPKH
jgi:uncharacterized protein